MSTHSRAASVSNKSKDESGSIYTSIGGDDSEDESQDSAQAMELMVGLGMKQKIDALKMRRRSDRLNVILTAAGRGDLHAIKQALKVLAVKLLSCKY